MNNDTGRIYNTMERATMFAKNPSHVMALDPTPQQRLTKKVGRNDPCPCGSGLKFKKCHLGQSADFKP